MKKYLEIPQGKRTRKYRFLEILPGLISYSLIILLFVLSWINPLLGTTYLFVIIATTLVRAFKTSFRTVQGYKVMNAAMRVDWRKRVLDLDNAHERYEELHGQTSSGFEYDKHIDYLKMISTDETGVFPKSTEIYNAVLVMAYNEPYEVLEPSIQAVADNTFPSERIILVLGFEERGGEGMEETAKRLKKKFDGVFFDFVLAKHPANLKGEVIGKGPNLCWAGKTLREFVDAKGIEHKNVMVTSLDCDNKMHPSYLDALTYQFIVHTNRQRMAYQPISIFTNNIWEVPAPMRVIAVSNSFFNVISTMRPHSLKNFASHSQPLEALVGMNYWSRRTIVEDGHQYWRSLFYFDGDYSVMPVRIPIYQDAVAEEKIGKTFKAQFIQLRRWYYGASDVAYVGNRLFAKDRKMPFWSLLAKFWILLEGHFALAALAPIVAFGAFVPSLVNQTSRMMVTYSLPSVISVVQTIAVLGLLVSLVVSLQMLPKRPKGVSWWKSVGMVVQWVLSPIVAIVFTSAAAFYSQTRLMFGKYMEKFDVTKKIAKKSVE